MRTPSSQLGWTLGFIGLMVIFSSCGEDFLEQRQGISSNDELTFNTDEQELEGAELLGGRGPLRFLSRLELHANRGFRSFNGRLTRVRQHKEVHFSSFSIDFLINSYQAVGSRQQAMYNDLLAKEQVGYSVRRTPFNRIRQLQRINRQQYANFIIYADHLSVRSGDSYRFSSPIPVFAVPDDLAALEALGASPLVYETRVLGMRRDNFALRSTVSVSGIDRRRSRAVIRIDHEIIGADSPGALREKLPLPDSTQFHIVYDQHSYLGIATRSTINSDTRRGRDFERLDFQVSCGRDFANRPLTPGCAD